MILFRKAVLIIHGFAGGTYDEENLANFLEKNPRLDVYSFTLPGHEKKSFKTPKYTEWIKCSEQQIEKLTGYGYKDIYLVGHSMGGVIASYLSTKYKQVKKLVLAAPAFNYLTMDNDNRTFEKIKKSVLIIKNNDKDEILTRFLKLPLSSVKEFSELIKKYKNSYKKINVPTMILHGDADTLVPLKSSIDVFETLAIKNKSLIVLNGVSHDIFREISDTELKQIESLEKKVEDDEQDMAQYIFEIKQELDSKMPQPAIIKRALRALKTLKTIATEKAIEYGIDQLIPLL